MKKKNNEILTSIVKRKLKKNGEIPTNLEKTIPFTDIFI